MSKPGNISVSSLRDYINKTAGIEVAHDLREDNPTMVKEWVPTGSRWLDSILCKGKMGGIPVGKITELAGLSGSGKSYMACTIAAQAQKMGKHVIYFDSESAMDPFFLSELGIDIDNLWNYVQASSCEMVLKMVESMMEDYPKTKFFFIWDSIAATSTSSDTSKDFNPQSSMAVKARVLSKALPKLVLPLANQQCTFLMVNQLKVNISKNLAYVATTPLVAPGGKSIEYFSSLRIWLVKRKAKAAYVTDSSGLRIGSEVKVQIEKSRFGSEGRTCGFKILWGDNVGIQDEESIFEALRLSKSNNIKIGKWVEVISLSGEHFKLRRSEWETKMLEDKEFRKAVHDILDEEMICKFVKEGKNTDIDIEEDK